MKRALSITVSIMIMVIATPLALCMVVWAMSLQIADDITGKLEQGVRPENKEDDY